MPVREPDGYPRRPDRPLQRHPDVPGAIDTNEVKIAGNSGSSAFCTMGGTQFGNCLNGIVYVPNSTQVTLATGKLLARDQGGRRAEHQGVIERDDRLRTRPCAFPPTSHSEDGFSLAELLVTIVLVGDDVRCDPHRPDDDDPGVGLASSPSDDGRGGPFGGGMGEGHQQNPYRTACNPLGMYSLSGLPAPSGYTASIKPVELLGRRRRSRAERTACSSHSVLCSGGDKGSAADHHRCVRRRMGKRPRRCRSLKRTIP